MPPHSPKYTLNRSIPVGMVLWFLHIFSDSLASIKSVIVMSEANWLQCLCLYKVNKKHSGSLSGPEGKWQGMAYIHMASFPTSLKHVSLACIAYWEPSQACLTLQTVLSGRVLVPLTQICAKLCTSNYILWTVDFIVPRPRLVQWWCLQWKLLAQFNW